MLAQPAIGGGVRYCTTCRAVYVSDFLRCPNDGGTLAITDDDPLVGTDVSHYHVDAFIGGGAMGRVYRAHHTLLHHKQVALKVLRGDLAATMAMRLRFTQEAESASRLVHPNVVSVSDFGRTETGLLFIAMDFIEGRNLADIIIEDGPLSVTRTIALAQQLCAGLGHAHDQGFVHRDFKPDNIIIVHEEASRTTPVPGAPVLPGGERARIVDFGLAIHADPDAAAARLTTAGAAVGTPVYAAPEQMQSIDEVDARADLFALGVTMFEMLAGDVPFDAGLMETLHLNATAERPSIASRARVPVTVPVRLERLVHRLMARAPADRPASTAEVFEELVAIELEVARGVAAIAMPRAPVTRRRWLPLAIAAVIAAGGALAYAAWFEPAPVNAPVVAIAPPHHASPVETPAPAQAQAIEPPPVEPPPAPAPLPPPIRVAHSHAHPHERVAAAAATPADAAPPPTVAEVSERPPVPADASVAALPPPPPPPPAPAPLPSPPKKVATSAQVAIENLSVRGALTTAQIRRALDRVVPQLRACYGPAATAAGSSPPISITTRFEIDESQRAHAIELAAPHLAGLNACVQRELANVRAEQPPDVGTVDVAFVLRFTPEGT
ncbi:MAG TPA: serine/threonine-protein kinase [Kofleriaceae bacterium]